MTERCRLCKREAAFVVGPAWSLNRVCEMCADRMIACHHDQSGTQHKEYDDDGCGYLIWCCDACGYEEIE